MGKGTRTTRKTRKKSKPSGLSASPRRENWSSRSSTPIGATASFGILSKSVPSVHSKSRGPSDRSSSRRSSRLAKGRTGTS
jgi:hypothetical protein